MSNVRMIYHIARADFLDRVRRYSFLMTLGVAVYLGLATLQGTIRLQLGEYVGVFNSAWVSALMTMVAGTFLSIAGFYVVRNSVFRDEQTRVGRVLAATPMTKFAYTAAKALSNLAVLLSMTAVLAAAAVILQYVRGEDTHFQLWAFVAPFLLVVLPAMAFTAAIAVLFETAPLLRSAAGNIIFFFVWTLLIVGSISVPHLDVMGLGLFFRSMTSTVRAIDPSFHNSFTLQLDFGSSPAAFRKFVWNGVDWTPSVVAERLLWIAVAAGLVAIAAFAFRRFDPDGDRSHNSVRHNDTVDSGAGKHEEQGPTHAVHLGTIAERPQAARFGQLYLTEWRLLTSGLRWWAYAISAGFMIAGFVSPLRAARFQVLAAAWIWPSLLLARSGARDGLYAMRALLFSCPKAITRQLASAWIAGASVLLALSIGVLARLLFQKDFRGCIAIVAGALFVSALSLLTGTLTSNDKSFAALYTIWWYIGPLHAIPGADFIGVTPSSARPALYLVLAIVAICSTFAARKVSLAHK